MSGGFLREKELVAFIRKVRQVILKPWQNTQSAFPDSAILMSLKQWGARQTLDLCAGSGAMRSNTRFEWTLVSNAPFLGLGCGAAQARR
jgi:hypothetical protein